ncbi:phytoene desaturase family protein [Streptomyces sp. NPDC001667]
MIGSGPGGLATAVCLSKLGKKVAVLEQHYTAGGYTHTYTRRGWEWDVGIHYVGHLGRREPVRTLSDYLSEGRLRWAEIGDPFDEYHMAGRILRAPVGYPAYKAALKEQFPAEAAAIDTFFRMVRQCVPAMPGLLLNRFDSTVLRSGLRWYEKRYWPEFAARPACDVVSELTDDTALRAFLLGPTSLLFVESASRLPFMMVAGVFEHFRTGAYYPVGGSSRIAASMLPVIKRSGGDVFVDAEVTEILLHQEHATGVLLADGTRIRARTVISNAGAENTFLRLLPAETSERLGYRELLAERRTSASFVVLFLGINCDPAEVGVPRNNILVLEEDDGDACHAGAPHHDKWFPNGLFISFSSAKDPTWPQRRPGRTTGEVIAFIRPELFTPWEGTRWGARGEGYERLKKQISERLLALLFTYQPQLAGKVAYHELGTPLSAEHFGRWPGGSLYGLALDTRNLLAPGPLVRPGTRIRRLYLTGQDALYGGFPGAILGGVLAAHKALGPMGRTRLWSSLAARTVIPRRIESPRV